ncbi:MAG: hypothetical protein QXV01_07360 [Candidatus Bathyarchaeia archaeon]
MYELGFVTDMVEEQIIRGNLRWLANFNEIHKDYTLGDVTFPIYASGSLQEKGFFLSKIFSALVTPKYKIHLFFYASQEVDYKFLRKIILSFKNKFGEDDWVFLGLVQNKPLEKELKKTIEGVTDKNIGITAFSLSSKETISSDNVLGKGLAKQLKLTEPKFEAFDLPSYLKGFTVVFGLGVLILVVISLSGLRQAIQPLTLLILTLLSLVLGHRVYKSRYHTTLTLNSKGFQLRQGQKVTEGKWSDYKDVTIYVSSKQETYLRLHSKCGIFDLPTSRVGMSRKEAYNAIKQLVKRE